MTNYKRLITTVNSILLSCSALFILSNTASATESTSAQFKIDRLEPLSWWVDMKSDQLQLMVYGPNISQFTPKFDNDNIRIDKVTAGDSPNYLFIDLTLLPNLQQGSYPLDFYRGNSKVASYQYSFNARNKHSVAATSFTQKDVIYLLTPDRFANGDASNDGVPQLIEQPNRQFKGGRHGGDIQGIINSLPYLANMGFTQIWTNPMVENNQAAYSYHGYSATDFYQIDARFGSNALYKELSAKAQQQGIGIIKDVVLNHIGSNHWWMKDLPMKDWLNNQEFALKKQDFVGTHHKRESLHDPHAVSSDAKIFADGWFVPTMPDLNQRNHFMSTYLIQNTLWWIEYANLSGLRVDTYSYSDKDFLTLWTKRVTQEYPNINITGEEWTTNPAIVAYWQKGSNTHDEYQSYLPSVLDFPVQDALVNSLNNPENWNTGLNQLYQTIANDFLYGDPYKLVTFADNHDMSRIFTLLNEDMAKFKIAMTYIMTMRGIPQFFYGTEVAMTNPGTTDHGIIRSDFPGGWKNDKQNAFTGKNLTTRQQAARTFIKSLLNWRKGASAVHEGKLRHYAPKDGVYVYFRVVDNANTGSDDNANNVMVVINKNDKSRTINANDYQELLASYSMAHDVLNDKKNSLEQAITLAPMSATIFELNR